MPVPKVTRNKKPAGAANTQQAVPVVVSAATAATAQAVAEHQGSAAEPAAVELPTAAVEPTVTAEPAGPVVQESPETVPQANAPGPEAPAAGERAGQPDDDAAPPATDGAPAGAGDGPADPAADPDPTATAEPAAAVTAEPAGPVVQESPETVPQANAPGPDAPAAGERAGQPDAAQTPALTIEAIRLLAEAMAAGRQPAPVPPVGAAPPPVEAVVPPPVEAGGMQLAARRTPLTVTELFAPTQAASELDADELTEAQHAVTRKGGEVRVARERLAEREDQWARLVQRMRSKGVPEAMLTRWAVIAGVELPEPPAESEPAAPVTPAEPVALPQAQAPVPVEAAPVSATVDADALARQKALADLLAQPGVGDLLAALSAAPPQSDANGSAPA